MIPRLPDHYLRTVLAGPSPHVPRHGFIGVSPFFKGFLSTQMMVTEPSLVYNSLETSKFLRPKRRHLIFAAFI